MHTQRMLESALSFIGKLGLALVFGAWPDGRHDWVVAIGACIVAAVVAYFVAA